MLAELKWLATAELREGQIHTFPKRENTTELYCQQLPTMGELEKSCSVASRNHTKCLFPPYLNLPLVDRPGLLGTLMQSGRCHGKFPYHWRSVQRLLPSPWSERRLLLDHSSNAARCDLSHSQGSSQVPARASPLTALRLHMHWRCKEGRKRWCERNQNTGTTALHLTTGKCFRNLTWKANSIWWKEDYFIWICMSYPGKSLVNFYTHHKARQVLSISGQSIITQIHHFWENNGRAKLFGLTLAVWPGQVTFFVFSFLLSKIV